MIELSNRDEVQKVWEKYREIVDEVETLKESAKILLENADAVGISAAAVRMLDKLERMPEKRREALVQKKAEAHALNERLDLGVDDLI